MSTFGNQFILKAEVVRKQNIYLLNSFKLKLNGIHSTKYCLVGYKLSGFNFEAQLEPSTQPTKHWVRDQV